MKEDRMGSKRWFLSRTEWLNVIGAAIAIVQILQGSAWISPETQILILAILNAILRFMTNTAITK